MKKKKIFFFLMALLWVSVVSAQNGLVQGYVPQGPTYYSSREDAPGTEEFLRLTFTEGKEVEQLSALLIRINSLQVGKGGEILILPNPSWGSNPSKGWVEVTYQFTEGGGLQLFLHLARVEKQKYQGYWRLGENGTHMPVQFNFDQLYPTADKKIFAATGGSKAAALTLYFSESIFLEK